MRVCEQPPPRPTSCCRWLHAHAVAQMHTPTIYKPFGYILWLWLQLSSAFCIYLLHFGQLFHSSLSGFCIVIVICCHTRHMPLATCHHAAPSTLHVAQHMAAFRCTSAGQVLQRFVYSPTSRCSMSISLSLLLSLSHPLSLSLSAAYICQFSILQFIVY